MIRRKEFRVYEPNEEFSDSYENRLCMFSGDGDSGLQTDRLKILFEKHGFVFPSGKFFSERQGALIYGVPKHVIQNIVPKKVFFLSMEQFARYDPNTYDTVTFVHTLFKNETKKHMTYKHRLHKLLTEQGSDIICETYFLDDFKYTPGTVWILRPSGPVYTNTFAGKGIMMVSNVEEFEEAKSEYAKMRQEIQAESEKLRRVKPGQKEDYEIIVSRYILNPALIDGKKFHIRFYVLVMAENPDVGIKFNIKITEFGSIMTANNLYVNDDFSNIDIHDTHFRSTEKDMFYPDDLDYLNIDEPLEIIKSKIVIQLKQFEKDLEPIARSARRWEGQAKVAYEIFAIDTMLTQDCKLYLLELNDRVGYKFHDYNIPRTVEFFHKLCDFQWEHAIYPCIQAFRKFEITK